MLEGKPVSEETAAQGAAGGTLSGKLTPIYCGSSKNFHGVRLLLDAVVDFLPSPLDRPPVSGIVPKTKEKSASGSPIRKSRSPVWRSRRSRSRPATWCFLRIYSGELRPKDDVLNTAVNRGERVARIYRMMGDRRDSLDVAGPGEIVAVVGLKQTYTGNTLCANNAPMSLEDIRFPEPVISQAIIPDKTTDETKLADALGKMVRDDPTLKCRTDPETNQLIISGMGELHLEVSVEKLSATPASR